jgi:hypothetical protein
VGQCRICGQRGALSFEHVPPRSAFNRLRVEQFTIDHWLTGSGDKPSRRGRVRQRGTGDFVLCERCNNLTGRVYVPELVKLVRAGAVILAQLPADQDAAVEPMMAGIKLAGVRPLRLAKQIVAMTLAINGEEFGQTNPALSAFVLDPDERGLPPGFELYLVLYRGPLARQSGVSGRLDVETGASHLLTEIARPPFAYVMSIDEPSPVIPLGRITHFADFEPTAEANLDLELLVGFGHTPYPADYRTGAAMDRDREINRAESAGS